MWAGISMLTKVGLLLIDNRKTQEEQFTASGFINRVLPAF
jgi:hypothetical protein